MEFAQEIRNRRQISLLILSESINFCQLLFSLKASENLWFYDDFKCVCVCVGGGGIS